MSSQQRLQVALFATTLIFCALGNAAAQEPLSLRPSTEDDATAGQDDIVRAQDGAISGEIDAAETETPPLDDAALSEALQFDDFAAGVKPKQVKTPQANSDVSWSRSDNTDGTSAYSVKRPLAAPMETTVGADFNVVMPATPSPGSGAAWANVEVPHVATLGVRAEPSNDYAKFGTSVGREVPVGSNYAVTVQRSMTVTDLYASLGSASPAPDAKIYETDNSVKFSIRSSGTALSAGTLTSSVDPATHTRLTAEQNIYGPLNVTGSVYDPGKASTSTSIGAGLKFNW
jgi:hypothetical protein